MKQHEEKKELFSVSDVQTADSLSIRFASQKSFFLFAFFLTLRVGRIIEFLKSLDFPLLFLLFEATSDAFRCHQSHKEAESFIISSEVFAKEI